MYKKELELLADEIIEHSNLNTESDGVAITFFEKYEDVLVHTHVCNLLEMAKAYKSLTTHVIIVYSDGSSKCVLRQHAWEYEADPDYLVTLPLVEFIKDKL